ncbi:hypothetical protein JQC65_26275, partial [Escherichia coli]|uniref:hypothetical protein n=1 Tax=Escherichia coli TaxID=562 RepID=UPI001CBC28C4
MITFVSLIIGYLLAVQYQSTVNKESKDSSDISPLRHELQTLRQQNQSYRLDIANYDERLKQYQTSGNQRESLNMVLDEVARLKELTGLAPIQGKGIILRIEERDSTD